MAPDDVYSDGYQRELFDFWQVVGNAVGQECKERRLAPHEHPVALMLLWPKLPIKDNEPKHGSRLVSLPLLLPNFCYAISVAFEYYSAKKKINK